MSITLLACEMNAIVQSFEHSLGLPFFGIGMKTERWEYQTTWPTSLETYMQVRKQQLELDMEQKTGSK